MRGTHCCRGSARTGSGQPVAAATKQLIPNNNDNDNRNNNNKKKNDDDDDDRVRMTISGRLLCPFSDNKILQAPSLEKM